ncbi:MAG: ABC transporter permease [Peptococcaceae bacterium]
MHLADIVLRHLWRCKAGILFLLTGIMLGVAAVVALYTLSFAMEEEVGNRFDQIGANIIIVPGSAQPSLTYAGITIPSGTQDRTELSENAAAKIRTITNGENISVIAPKLLGMVETETARVLAVGVDFARELKIKKWWKPEGQVPVRENQVMLGRGLSTRLQKQVGSTINIGNTEMVVTGILNEMGSEEDDVLYLSLPVLQRFLHKEGKLSYLEVSALCYTCPIEDMVGQISAKLPDAKVTAVLEAVEARKAIVDKFSALARVVSAIILIVGALLAGNSLVNAVNGRLEEMGILGAIGFNKKHLITLILLENVVICSGGGILGFVTGTIMAKGLAPIIARMEVAIVWEWRLGAIALLLAVMLGAAAGLFPALRVLKQNPGRVMGLS